MSTRVMAPAEMRCDMNIQRFRDRRVDTRSKPVEVETIGNEQLQFVSDLRLPAQETLVLGFRLAFRRQAVYGEGTIAAAEKAPHGAGYRYSIALTRRSVEDARWRQMVDCVYAAQQEQYERIERLYRLCRQEDAGIGQLNVRL